LKKFIFDIDGTLTLSRQPIDTSFQAFMIVFCCKHPVYLVTGSDRQKTIDQVGLDICYRAEKVYNCSGADAYKRDTNVYRSSWELPDNVEKFLKDELDYSQFPIRNGLHIEHRPGGVNFSILGRGTGVDLSSREEYVKWDRNTGERKDIADRLKNEFPELNVQIGGQTGLDISNGDKSQILRDFNPNDELHFFGDMMNEGENDYPLSKAVEEMGGYTYHVRDFRHTWSLLNKMCN
tara:strand:+ start:114 stop:818 length:705 start_codon:yes stop_codon:yes gene_type:complete